MYVTRTQKVKNARTALILIRVTVNAMYGADKNGCYGVKLLIADSIGNEEVDGGTFHVSTRMRRERKAESV